MSNPYTGTTAVVEGSTSVDITAPVAYGPWVSPNWNTTTWLTSVTATGFTVNFSVPAPANAEIRWAADIAWTSGSNGFDTFGDIVADMLDRAGEDPTDTAGDYFDTAMRQGVRGYHDLCNAYPFLFLRSATPAVIQTKAPITTGTVNVQADSANITFSSAPSVSVAGRKILVTGCNEWYRVSTHTAGAAAATLDAEYAGTTDAAAAYTVYEDEYAVDTDLRHILGLYVAEDGTEIVERQDSYLRATYPVPVGAWPPTHFARIGENRIRFSHYPLQKRRIEVHFTVIPDDPDGGTILVPRNWRYVIADAGLFWLLQTKDDSRASAAEQLYLKAREELIQDDDRKRSGLRARVGGR